MEQTYKIGEAAELLNLKTYVLRFWETEFPQISPLRTEKGQRLYTSKDLEMLKRIRYLLHEQGLTIDGARKILEGNNAGHFLPPSQPETSITPPPPSPYNPGLGISAGLSGRGLSSKTLRALIQELEEVAALLRAATIKGSRIQ